MHEMNHGRLQKNIIGLDLEESWNSGGLFVAYPLLIYLCSLYAA